MTQTFFDILPPILNVIFNLILICFFFNTYYKFKKGPTSIAIFVVFILGFFLNVSLIKFNILRIAIMILCIFLLSFAFNMKLSQKIVFTLLYQSLQGISELLTIFIQMFIFSIDLSTINTQPNFTINLLISYFALFFMLFINRRAKHKTPIGYSKIFYILLSLPAATLLTLYVFHRIAGLYLLPQNLSLALIISCLMLVATNFIVFYVADNLFDKIQYESRLRIAETLIAEQSKKYSEILSNSTELRQIRHDEINFCYGLLTSLKTNQINDAINQLTDKLNIAQNIDLSQQQEVFFETIIRFKENEVSNEMIKFKSDIRTTASELHYNQVDIAILLGSLIDNAVDASRKFSDVQKRSINIFIENIQSQLLISIYNPTVSYVDTTKLNSTKKHPEEHGFGLIAVKSIVEKYNGEIFFKSDNNIFEVSIVLN